MGWGLATGLIVSALLGKKASDKASDVQSQAIASQQSWEAARDKRAQEHTELGDRLLFGRLTGEKYPEGHEKAGQTMVDQYGDPLREGGAWEQAQLWTDDYLNWLKTSPDITYNAQRGRMEGDIKTSMEQAARMLGRRGLSDSGVADATMGNIAGTRAGLLSQMEAGRYDRQGERLGIGSQLTESQVDRALNLRGQGLGLQLQQQTMVPQMQTAKAEQYAGQAGAYGNLLGAGINYYLQSQVPQTTSALLPQTSTAIPTTVPTNFQLSGAVPTSKYQWQ